MKKLLLPILLLIAACTTSGSDNSVSKITVSQATWGHFQEYLAAIAVNRPGAFAIEKDGDGSYYIWCRELQCIGGASYKQEALRSCEQDGADCVIFAFRRDILVPYEVEKTPSSAQMSNALTPEESTPAIRTTRRISSALQAEIEEYLANSAGETSTYRFLALNETGDKLGRSTGCKKLKTGWGGWTAGGCGGEADAMRRAIDDCGANCEVIYNGDRKIGAFEIEWY